MWSQSRLKWIENLCKSICVLAYEPTHPKLTDGDINSRIWVALAADTNLILLLLCATIGCGCERWIFFRCQRKLQCNKVAINSTLVHKKIAMVVTVVAKMGTKFVYACVCVHLCVCVNNRNEIDRARQEAEHVKL